MITALMIDVDEVLVTGRPEDGENWAIDLERDLGVRVADLQREFFTRYWDETVVGRAHLSECLASALARIAPHVRCDELISYWFERDSRLEAAVLRDIAACRIAGIRVYLATNQEHMRAAYLMQVLGLAENVNGIFYSAEMRCRKPERQFFQKIELRTGRDPSEILLVDDSLANVAAARDAGWKAVHWMGESSLSAILASFPEDFAPLSPVGP